MKAKYKNTGEIVEIDSVSIVFKDITNDKFCRGDEIDFVTEPEIDWEQRRYEIAKEMIAAFLSNSCSNVYVGNPGEQAKCAVMFADALIFELKNDDKNDTDADH